MKEGFVVPEVDDVSDDDIKRINKFTKREMKKDEIYVFSVVLCDNEIDRENERFTVRALEKLAKLFVGKTGILDHDAKSEKQSARIFSCSTEIFKEKNSLGENYSRLVAKAYIPRTKSSQELISQIDAGIKKEVSIRCLIEKNMCSICGRNIKLCNHRKGEKYNIEGNETRCYAILDNPIDAYEWSFVAIPSQASAGVIKTFSKNIDGAKSLDEDIKKIKNETSKNGMKKIYRVISQMECDFNVGREYIHNLKTYVTKRLSFMRPKLENSIISKMISALDVDELEKMKRSFSDNTLRVQFLPTQKKVNSNYEFKI